MTTAPPGERRGFPAPPSLRLGDSTGLLAGVGRARAAALAQAGLATVRDLLLALPFRYEDRRSYGTVSSLAPGTAATLFVKLSGVRAIRMRRGTLRIEAIADDGTGAVRVVWHNRYPSFAQSLASGRTAAVYGAPVVTGRGEIRLENPETELFDAEEEADPLQSGRIVGVYHRVAGLPAKARRRLVRRALDLLDPDFATATASASLLRNALEGIHFPGEMDAPERFRSLLAREELLVLAARIETKRARLRSRVGARLSASDSARELARRALPFRLTGAQKRAVRQIAEDLDSGRAMARLLQGDVGSGKTVVAGLALLLAATNGAQAALMAPTEILAEQHARTLAGWLAETGVRIGLLTGRVRTAARRRLLEAVEAGELDVLVGTHALIESPVRFRNLALIVVDEQHRFGVAHRARLFRKGSSPHVLVMTATPIPRSLAWAIYGELDVSVLDEKPPGRARISTRVRSDEDRDRIYRFAGERVRAGERVYVVVPTIEGEDSEIAATRQTAERIAKAVPGVPIDVLHGRLPPEDRSRVLARFAEGGVGILVSTTVVEVGVDVPEATLMIVENAERFGLAQLHQLRGRVGRSPRRSWCALIVGKRAGPDALERLGILERTSDGFLIAEKDLEARGPGDLLGTQQSGLPPLRVADPIREIGWLGEARLEAARRLAGGEKIVSDLFAYPDKSE